SITTSTSNRTGGWYSHRASKAAVVSITRGLDLFLEARGGARALAVAYHPGTVRTDLSREFWASVPEGRLFSPEFAAARLVDVVCGLRVEQRGRCWDWKGDEVPP
ncbi:C-factor, partial [Tolypocladium ophioglossoides CBS 100239]